MKPVTWEEMVALGWTESELLEHSVMDVQFKALTRWVGMQVALHGTDRETVLRGASVIQGNIQCENAPDGIQIRRDGTWMRYMVIPETRKGAGTEPARIRVAEGRDVL